MLKSFRLRFLQKLKFIILKADPFLYLLSRYIGAHIVIPVTLPNRIGHLLVEIDSFLKEIELGDIPRRKYILLSSNPPLANSCIKEILPSTIYTSNAPFLRIGPFFFGKFPRSYIAIKSQKLQQHFSDYATSIYSTATCCGINAKWNWRQPLFSITSSMKLKRKHLFTSIGWDPSQKYVVLHARGPGYSPSDEHYHTYRNTSIAQFDNAIDFLVSQNVFIVRIGDPTMEPCAPREGLYDYAISSLVDPTLDLALCAESLFLLGSASGAYLMAMIFGVPVAVCNQCLPITYSTLGGRNHIGIPKLMQRISTSKLVPYPEIFENRSSEWRIPADFDDSDYELVENTPEEIKDLAHEALLRAQGNWQDSPDDLRRQAQFSSLIRPGSYSYGSASQCGRAFMKKYEHLLGFDSACMEAEQLR